MGRTRRTAPPASRLAAAVVAAGMVGALLVAVPAPPAGAAEADAHSVAANVCLWLGKLAGRTTPDGGSSRCGATEEADTPGVDGISILTTPLPFSRTTPLSATGLSEKFARLAAITIADSQASDLDELAELLEQQDDTTPDGELGTLDVIAEVDGTALDLTLKATGAVETLDLSDDSVEPPVRFTVDGLGGVYPVTTTVTARLEPGNVADGDLGFVSADPAPTIEVQAATNGLDLAGRTSAIGIGDVRIQGPAPVEIKEERTATLTDPDGDGRLRFTEPNTDQMTLPSLGELGSISLEDLVETSCSQRAEPKLGEDGNGVEVDSLLLDLDPAARITVATAGEGCETTFTGTVDFIGNAQEQLKPFNLLTPYDLLGGLTQYATLLRAAARTADADLPILEGSLTDLYDAADALDTFVAKGAAKDSLDAESPELGFAGVRSFTTAVFGEGAAPVLKTDPPSIVIDAVLRGTETRTPDDFAVPSIDGSESAEAVAVGAAAYGDEIRRSTGLRGIVKDEPDLCVKDKDDDPDPCVTEIIARLPFIIDLRPAVVTDDPGTTTVVEGDDPATPVVETQVPMPYERFLTTSAGTPELAVDLTASLDPTGTGFAGPSPIEVLPGSAYQVVASVDVDLDPVIASPAPARSSCDPDKPDPSPPGCKLDTDAGVQFGRVLAALQNGERGEAVRARRTVDSTVTADLVVNHTNDEGDKLLGTNDAKITLKWTAQEDDVPIGAPVDFGTPEATGDTWLADLDPVDALLRAAEEQGLPDVPLEDVDPTRYLNRVLEQLGELGTALPLDTDDFRIPFLAFDPGDAVRELLGRASQQGGEVAEGICGLGNVADVCGLGDVIGDLRNRPSPVSIQDVERAVDDAFPAVGDPPRKPLDLDFTVERLATGAGGTATYLVATLRLDKGKQIPLPPLAVDLGGGLPSLVGASCTVPGPEPGGDPCTVDLELSGDLGIPIPLTPDGDTLSILSDSSAKVSASFLPGANETPGPATITANLGPVVATLGDDGPSSTQFGFRAGLTFGEEGAARKPVAIKEWRPEPAPTGPLTCATEAAQEVSGALGCIVAPVTLAGQQVDGTLGIGFGIDPPFDVVSTPNFSELLPNLDFSFDSLDEGLDSVLRILELAENGARLGRNLPGIGDDLSAGADYAGKLRMQIEQALERLRGEGVLAPAAGLRAPEQRHAAPAPGDDTAVPGGAIAALQSGVNPDYIAAELGAAATCDYGNGFVTPCNQPLNSLQDVRFVKGVDADGGKQLDLGLDGIPLEVTGDARLNAEVTGRLTFGISRELGFYVLPGQGNTFVSTAVSLDLGAAALAARLGFLGVEITDLDPSEVDVEGSIGARLTNPAGADQPLTIKDLARGPALLDLQDPLLTVDLDVGIATKVGDADIGKYLPDFGVEFLVECENTTCVTEPTVEFRNLSIELPSLVDKGLRQLIVNLQELIEPLDPVIDFLQAPIPVLSDLSRKFGGPEVTPLSLAKTLGFVDGELLGTIGKARTLIKAINGLRPAAGDITLLDEKGNPRVWRISGSEARGAPKEAAAVDELFDEKPPSSSGSVFDQLGLPDDPSRDDDITDQIKALTGTSESGQRAKAASSSAGLQLPLLDNPACLLKVLLGGDCDLLTFDTGRLRAGFEYEQSFGPFFGVVYATIGGSLEVSGGLRMGYSTRGIRMLAEASDDGKPTDVDCDALYNPEKPLDPGGDPLTAPVADRTFCKLADITQARKDAGDENRVADLLTAVYLDDLDASGKDIAEISASAEISAGGKIDIIIAEAGIKGGIRANVDLNLNDSGAEPDGKLYLDEIIDRIDSPACLFDISGKLQAFLKVYAEFGICPFCDEVSFTLAKVTLLDFKSQFCEPKKPVLATTAYADERMGLGQRFQGEGTWEATFAGIEPDPDKTKGPEDKYVRLGIGNSRNFDFTGQTGSESFMVTQLDDAGPDGLIPFRVSAFGDSEEISGKGILVFDAGEGDDRIVFNRKAPDVGSGEVPTTAPPFSAPVYVNSLGPGDDSIVTGAGNDEVLNGVVREYRQEVSYNPSGGVSGVRWVLKTTRSGGDGDDSLSLGDGNNIAAGGAGNDTITTGAGRDRIFGDSGLAYGRSSDGQPAAGDDTIETGPGKDIAFGGPGNDAISAGDEAVCADGPSTDTAGPPCDDKDLDYLIGGSNNDTINGGSGDDCLIGDGRDPDLVSDVPLGCSNESSYDPPDPPDGRMVVLADGADAVTVESLTPLSRGLHDDVLTAGPGDDEGWGGPGNDILYGGGRGPKVPDTGTDTLHGGQGDDQILGSGGDDDLFGDEGRDLANGEDGNDKVYGNAGDDDLAASGPVKQRYPTLRGLTGGPGSDDVWGGAGADRLSGGSGPDRLRGDGGLGAGDDTTGPDRLSGDSGDDVVVGDTATILQIPFGPAVVLGAARSCTAGTSCGDVALGGTGDDVVWGEAGDDRLWGGSGNDTLRGNHGSDQGKGESGRDLVRGDEDDDGPLNGGQDRDLVAGNEGNDVVEGGADDDELLGGSDDDGAATGAPSSSDADDRLSGQHGDDRLYGDSVKVTGRITDEEQPSIDFIPSPDTAAFGNDRLRGGAGQDLAHGQDGDDDLLGGADHDQLHGDLGDDTLDGGAGPDYLIGDRAVLDPEPRDVTAPAAGWAPGTPTGSPLLRFPEDPSGPGVEVQLADPSAGGGDTLKGGAGDDHAWGGAGDDTLQGGPDDDYLEGNDGQDALHGLDEIGTGPDGQDDLIGGSSPANPQTEDGAPDTGELVVRGNDAQDVIAGDNATIRRQADDSGENWKPDPVTGGHHRDVRLLDTERRGAALASVSGNDLLAGDGSADRLFGQGGNDRGFGNDGDDLLEGNQDRDWLEGNAGEDDLVGGSAEAGQPDDGDVLHGGAGADVLAGDNAEIARDVPGVTFDPSSFTYVTDLLGIGTRRGVTLLDLDAADPEESGPDQLSGGQGADTAFGQDDDDWLSGGSDDDYQQGNGGSDRLLGDRPLGAFGPVLPAPAADLPGAPSAEPDLSGPPGPDGQDDQIGGSNLAGHRDAGDMVWGDGEADFQLGDNGELDRTIEGSGAARRYGVQEERYPGNVPPPGAVVERRAERFDAGRPAGAWGDDELYGGDGVDPQDSTGDAPDGDDAQWGQDGDDRLFGENGHDDQLGELGDDVMFGGAGEDAMVGDRGGIVTRYVDGDRADPVPADGSFSVMSPPGMSWTGFAAHPLDRRVSLTNDPDGSVLLYPGTTEGGRDRMRGGPGHDSLHGAAGDDLMNGDTGGDYLLGADGSDVMWGGQGNPTDDADQAPQWRDILLGGRGGSRPDTNLITGGADIIDYQPRPGQDPAEWFTMTAPYGTTVQPQDHQGTDWLYGGADRDVLQGDRTSNGPNAGDKLLDWVGAFNLYTHCNAAYGGWNDVRVLSPTVISALERLAYAVGAGNSLQQVRTPGTSAYLEAAVVYTKDVKDNSGKAYPTTPGNFERYVCN